MNWMLWKFNRYCLRLCHLFGDRRSFVRSYFYGRAFRYFLRTDSGQAALHEPDGLRKQITLAILESDAAGNISYSAAQALARHIMDKMFEMPLTAEMAGAARKANCGDNIDIHVWNAMIYAERMKP